MAKRRYLKDNRICKKMKILGISAYYHDSAAAIIYDNVIISAAQEERFTRIKHDASFPSKSILFCLQYSGLRLNELDAVVFYDKPFLKFERLLETYYTRAPRGVFSFIKSMPVWLKEKIFLRKLLVEELKKIDPELRPSTTKILFCEHHLSHAASAFYVSPFHQSAILTIDGVGEWATASICIGKGTEIKMLKELYFPDSVGLLYSSFTYFLGFKVNSGEYKLMGLAPYGNINDIQTIRFISVIRKYLVNIYSNGSIKLNQKFFRYATGLKMIDVSLWENLFGIRIRKPSDKITQDHCNLAIAIQVITEEIVLKMANHVKEITGSENLCMAGGVALNCVANGKLQKTNLFKDIFIQPAAGDAGGALGAALAANHIYYKQERLIVNGEKDLMQNAFLGPEYSELNILQMIRKFKAVCKKYNNNDELNSLLANYLLHGTVVGRFDGRMEFGPRALGNRSILANPLIPGMQKVINLKIKFREGFRPFAAVTSEEDAKIYFDLESISPYMLLVQKINLEFSKPLPELYEKFLPEEKLSVNKSEFSSVTHADLSCRIQTVNKKDNPGIWNLLYEFKKLSGFSLLLNTSFNIRGEPIVCTPDEAYTGFMRTEMDVLVMNNFIFMKEDQPGWNDFESGEKYLQSD
jgi:carbamoyltransferase